MEYEQTMAGFEIRRKLLNRIGWVIFRRWVQSQMGLCGLMLCGQPNEPTLRAPRYLGPARSIKSIRVQSPFQMVRGGGATPSESDKGVRCSG
jgi:hypothetical protein